MNAIRTKHDLDFFVADWPMTRPRRILKFLTRIGIVRNDDPFDEIEWQLFRVGTCDGQCRFTPEAIEVLSIVNGEPGNGHLEDVLEWFEYSCRRSGLPLRVLRFTNEAFKRHLIEKRGFTEYGKYDVEKYFTLVPK